MKDVKTLFETEPYTEEVFLSFLADRFVKEIYTNTSLIEECESFV